MKRLLRVGVTHGDINGISYEIIIKAFSDERMLELCTPVIFGSAKLMGFFRKMVSVEEFRFNTVRTPEDAVEGQCNVVNISDEEFKVEIGTATPESARAAMMSLEAGVDALRRNLIDVLVTCPINKAGMYGDSFPFPGHTEYLQKQLGSDDDRALMILFDDFVKVALVTTHIPLRDVASLITQDNILRTLRIFNHSLKQDFRTDCPKIAVLSLNPHCGDLGVLGNEETEIIIPAIDAANSEGILAFGPYAADGFFGAGRYVDFDGVVAMYHDQGLAPFKALAGPAGVNFTAGLPFIRTSPDHGTGYDIVGKDMADPESLRQAVYKAIDIWCSRTANRIAHAHPLKKQYEPRGEGAQNHKE